KENQKGKKNVKTFIILFPIQTTYLLNNLFSVKR
ncbi:jg18211, partial [Pararge aegeria aegeria]